MTRVEELRNAIASRKRVLVMFSGGLDSALLAKLAFDALGQDAMALTIDSEVIPPAEITMAREMAVDIGIPHHVVRVEELEQPHFQFNPPDRCYHCRKVRDALARRWATEHGFTTIADGLNYSDLSDFRPGLKAANEDEIWHPFIEFSVTKDEIRTLTKELGLRGSDRPSMACLASRFPHGAAVTTTAVERVERAEDYLHSLGFKRVRVRYFPYHLAMVETDEPARAVEMRDQLVRQLQSLGFAFVTLDLEDFASGKMNRTADI
jgi:pyridinium-3,5-biscarboxylic acid mononucleotide sulfurtransferase